MFSYALFNTLPFRIMGYFIIFDQLQKFINKRAQPFRAEGL